MINVNTCPDTDLNTHLKPRSEDFSFGNVSFDKPRFDKSRFDKSCFDKSHFDKPCFGHGFHRNSDRPSPRSNLNINRQKFGPVAHSYLNKTVLYDYASSRGDRALEGDRASTTADSPDTLSTQNNVHPKFHHLSRAQRQQLKRLVQRNRIRKIRPVYWRRLVEVGVPVQVAEVIAKAIAQYDASRQQPNSVQQHLIREYCRFVCRAELWRSQLLEGQVA